MRRLILGVLLACVMLNANAADETLIVGGIKLTLGMERARALDALQKLKVNCLGNEKTPAECNWIVSRGNKQDSDFVVLGSIYFSEGGRRIKTVMKNYNQEQWGANPEKFISFLYEVLRQYGANGETFIASVAEVREPGWTAKDISFRSGRRVIAVGYGEGNQNTGGTPYKPFISMYEKLA